MKPVQFLCYRYTLAYSSKNFESSTSCDLFPQENASSVGCNSHAFGIHRLSTFYLFLV